MYCIGGVKITKKKFPGIEMICIFTYVEIIYHAALSELINRFPCHSAIELLEVKQFVQDCFFVVAEKWQHCFYLLAYISEVLFGSSVFLHWNTDVNLSL